MNSLNQTSEEDVNTEVIEDETPADESENEEGSVDQAQLDLQEKNKKLFERAKKAEAELKALKSKSTAKPNTSEKQDGISSLDAIALIKANITEKEDIDEVLEYSKLKGISIQESLKSNVVRVLLAEKAEQRRTAEATNTSAARRGNTVLPDESIVSNANQGKFPEDPAVLAKAQFNLMKKANSNNS